MSQLTFFPCRRGVTAASVALAEAGIQMYGLVVGCCAVSPTGLLRRLASALTSRPAGVCPLITNASS